MARKTKSAGGLWDDNPAPAGGRTGGSDANAPLKANPTAPSEVLRQKQGKLRRFATYSIVFAGIPAMVLLGASIITQEDPIDPKDFVTDSVTVNDSVGKSVAYAELNRWLEADPSPLPGARLVSWDGFEPIAAGKRTSESDKPADAGEIHYFTLTTTADTITLYYTASVLVSVDDALGATVQGTPSLMPQPANADSGWSSQTWAGYEDAGTGAAVEEAVDAWAKAFTSSPADLRLQVGDGNTGHSYVPLLGATVVSSDISASGALPSDEEGEPTEIIVRATLSIRWTADDQEKPTLVTYDLLVSDANTAAPRVVAWGAPGEGPKLVPYGNAVTDRAVSDTTPSQSAQPSEEPAAEEPSDNIEEGE